MHAQPTTTWPKTNWPNDNTLDRIAFGVLLIVALIAIATFQDYGLGWDDYTHAQEGELLLRLYSSGFQDTRALSFVNLYMYGGGFDMTAALLAKVLPFGLFETRRLVGAAVGLIGLAVTWRLGRRIGSPLAGLIALLLLATCPLYYGHMFFNAKDAPFAVAMAILLLGVVRALEQYPRPSRSTLAIFGLGLGLSIGSRIMAGFGVVTAFAALALIVAADARADGARAAFVRLGSFILALVPAVILGYAVMALIWPWAVVDPLNPIYAINYFSQFFEKPWFELFEGVRTNVTEMPRRYVPVLFGLRMPELFLALASAGVAGAFIAAFRPGIAPRRRAVFVSVALSAMLPLLVTVATRPAMYNGIRHFVFVLPPLAIAGGLAGEFVFAWLQRYGRRAFIASAAVLAIGLLPPIVEMVRLHPYQYAYFNAFAGGVRGANGRYMLDYWGLAFKQAGNELRRVLEARGEAPPAGQKWKIAVCGPHPAAQIALGDQFEPTWEPKGADFALMLGVFYCARLDAPMLVQIEREGVNFARAYDIRGRNVPGMFTMPPVKRE